MTAEAFTAIAKTRTASLTTSLQRYGGLLVDGTADTAFGNLTTSSTVKDVIDILDALIARKLVNVPGSTNGVTSAVATEATGIGVIRDLTTSTAFTASQSALAVVIAGSATGTAATDGSGVITAITFTSDGNDYELGQTVSVTHSGGGVAGFIVDGLV